MELFITTNKVGDICFIKTTCCYFSVLEGSFVDSLLWNCSPQLASFTNVISNCSEIEFEFLVTTNLLVHWQNLINIISGFIHILEYPGTFVCLGKGPGIFAK